MSQLSRVKHPLISGLPTDVEGFDSLAELALDMRWSWNYAADQVWRQLDRMTWDLTHNLTARVIPHYSGVVVPLEAAEIYWQR